ncbi:unnamed protein product [Rhizopus stolonifer]
MRNAVEEGMVAALELFDEYRPEVEGRELVQHCILLSNSLPNKLTTRCNMDEKYDGLKMESIIEEMKKTNIRFSLISPNQGYEDLEIIVSKVNDEATEINTIKETAAPAHFVQLAGFKLPVVSTPQPNNVSAEIKSSPRPLVGSPQSLTSEAGKKRKRENIPGQIALPKASFDANRFAEASARVNSQIAQKQNIKMEHPIKETRESPVREIPTRDVKEELMKEVKMEDNNNSPIDLIDTPVLAHQATSKAPSPKLQHPPAQPSPQTLSQEQMLAIQQQTGSQIRPPTGPPQNIPGRMQNPFHLQQYLLNEKNNLLGLGPNLSPAQQTQLQTIQTALVKLSEQIRRSAAAAAAAAARGVMPPQNVNPNSPVVSSPFPNNAVGTPTSRPGADPTMQQNQMNMGSINPAQLPTNLTAQQRIHIANQLAQRNAGNAKPVNINELQAQLLQQQQQQQQQQQPVSTQPLWTGQIVWHIKTNENQLQEFNCLCGAFAIPTKGSSTGIEDYRPEVWPSRIQIAGRSPLSRANILHKQALENKLPICQFKPLSTSSQQDQTNFTLLVKNLEQKKYIATIVFNLAPGQSLGMGPEPHHGVVLTYSTGKLVGVVFTKVPLPDLNADLPTNNTPNGVFMPNMNNSPLPGSNITPAMLANLQNTANMGLLNTSSNPNVQLQNTLRQQQIMNPTNMVNPGTQQPAGSMSSLNPNNLLLSNMNMANTTGNINMNNINMANLTNLQPNAARELQQRIYLARQQQNQQQAQSQPSQSQQTQP